MFAVGCIWMFFLQKEDGVCIKSCLVTCQIKYFESIIFPKVMTFCIQIVIVWNHWFWGTQYQRFLVWKLPESCALTRFLGWRTVFRTIWSDDVWQKVFSVLSFDGNTGTNSGKYLCLNHGHTKNFYGFSPQRIVYPGNTPVFQGIVHKNPSCQIWSNSQQSDFSMLTLFSFEKCHRQRRCFRQRVRQLILTRAKWRSWVLTSMTL